MYRNDPILPTFALILAAGLFYAAYLDGLYIARLLGHTPEELSVGQIGSWPSGPSSSSTASSAWSLTGSRHRAPPRAPLPHPATAPVAGGVILVLLLTALSGFFVRLLIYSAQTGHNPTWLQGLIFGSISWWWRPSWASTRSSSAGTRSSPRRRRAISPGKR